MNGLFEILKERDLDKRGKPQTERDSLLHFLKERNAGALGRTQKQRLLLLMKKDVSK